jgi:osmotically-inducible protein OsmY
MRPELTRVGAPRLGPGHVRTEGEHDAVVSAAWMANGVVEVDDNLYIG